MHCFNVSLVEGIAAHWGSNRYITWGTGNLREEKKYKYTNDQHNNDPLLQIMLISVMYWLMRFCHFLIKVIFKYKMLKMLNNYFRN